MAAKREGSSSHPQAICGVRDEVAQVSMTSGSPMNPPGCPRWGSVKPPGTSVEGSTGSRSSSAKMGRTKATSPESSTGYQTGKGTPKNRCRLMFQSALRPSTQDR